MTDPDKPARVRSTMTWTMADRILVAMVGMVVVFALFQLLMMGFGRDQGIYAVVADSVLRGGMPYRDAWDFKPPGVFFVYAFAQALFGNNEWGIRLVEVFAFLSLLPIMGVLARRFFGDARIGWLAAALAIWIEAQLEFWHTAQPESFGGVLSLAGFVLSTHAIVFEDQGPRWKPWALGFAAGLVFGAAGLMKPHLLGVPIVAAIHAAWRVRESRQTVQRQVASFLAIGLGSVTTVVLCIAWFAVRGALGDLHHALFVFAPGYAATTWNSDYVINYTYRTLHGAAMGFSAISGLGIALTLGLGVRTARSKEGLWLFAASAFPQVVGIAIQSKFFPYHFGSVLPFYALLAGPGLWELWKRCQRMPVLGPTAFVLGLLIAADARTATRDLPQTFNERSWQRTKSALSGDPIERARVDAALYSVADVDYSANMRVAAWLAKNTTPSDNVYIWGFEPHIYFASDRRPASKFIYNVAQRVEWENQWARNALVQELKQTPPRVIVVEYGDIFPVVTGNYDDSKTALLSLPALQQLIDEQYVFRERIQDFDLYVRR